MTDDYNKWSLIETECEKLCACFMKALFEAWQANLDHWKQKRQTATTTTSTPSHRTVSPLRFEFELNQLEQCQQESKTCCETRYTRYYYLLTVDYCTSAEIKKHPQQTSPVDGWTSFEYLEVIFAF